MPSNVEIKARLEDFDAFHQLFKKVYSQKDDDCKTLDHCDTYFTCDNGRLKLRVIKTGDQTSAELIFYDRRDVSGPKLSDYVKHDCSADPASLEESLRRAYGVRGEVRKTRFLYIVDQTRVHIDKVDGLGQFMELEVMLRDGQTPEEGQKVAESFMEKLNITEDMLVKGCYIDLQEKEKKPATAAATVEDKEMEEVKEEEKKKEAEEEDKEMVDTTEEEPRKEEVEGGKGDAAAEKEKEEDKKVEKKEEDNKVEKKEENKKVETKEESAEEKKIEEEAAVAVAPKEA